MRAVLKNIRAIQSGIRLFRNPERLDEVFKLADSVLKREDDEILIRVLSEDPKIKKILSDRSRIGKIDREYLRQLPEGSLGKSFYDFITTNNIRPEDIPELPVRDDVDFVKAHLYETHDLYHVVLGFGTDPSGELGVQGFYASQMLSRHALFLLGLSMFNTLFFKMNEYDSRFKALTRGWLLGKSSALFFGIKWTDLWEVQLSTIRRDLGVDPGKIDQFIPIASSKYISAYEAETARLREQAS